MRLQCVAVPNRVEVLANLGAAYGTAKSGVGIANLGIMRPDMVMRSLIPVVMAGVLGIYGLITAVIINGKIHGPSYSAYSGYAHLAAGLTVGFSSLAAGMAIGVVGDAGVRANAQQRLEMIRGCRWGFLWPWMVFSIDFHGFPWTFHGFSMVFHGFSWFSMVFHGFGWFTKPL